MAHRHGIGHRAEPEHHLRRPGACDVARAEVAADRVELQVLPGVLIEGLERRAPRGLEAELHRAHRQQRVTRLGARHAKHTEVDRVDRVDAALNERALAPVDDLPPGANLAGSGRQREALVHERVAHLGAAADAAEGIVAQLRTGAVPVRVLEVVEREPTEEPAEVLVAELELRGPHHRVGVDALVVVQVPVVAVDAVGLAAGGQADDALVTVLEPEPEAEGERVVPVPLELARRRGGGLRGFQGAGLGGLLSACWRWCCPVRGRHARRALDTVMHRQRLPARHAHQRAEQDDERDPDPTARRWGSISAHIHNRYSLPRVNHSG